MARTELPNGVILPAEYSDDWYEDMTSNLTKLDDVIGSDSEKLNSNDVAFLRMSSTALTDGGTGNFSDLNSSNKLKTGDYVLDSNRKLFMIASVDSANETFTVGNSLFKVTAESDLAPVAESGDYDDLDNKPDLKPVATSGDYDDLDNKPDLKPVATSGDYDDLDNKPDLKPVATSGDYDDLDNKPDLKPVATSGDYDDLTDLPAYGIIRFCSLAITDNSSVAFSAISSTDKIKVGDFLLNTAGKMYQISSVDTANETVSVTTPLTQLAVDSSVVHNTGNEDVNGTKTFKDIIPIDGDYLGNEASNNQRTNICLRSNRDTANKSCAFITRFRQNRSQGALQTGDLQMIGFDVLENEVRTNNVLSIQCTGWLNDVPQRVNILSGAQSYSYGNSARKALFNDLNPGALSLPDLSNGIDISGYISYGADRYDSTYTVPANGYITIYGIGGGTASGIVITNGNCAQSSYSVRRANLVFYVGVTLPVSAGDVVTIGTNNITSLINAKFYPCLGNV